MYLDLASIGIYIIIGKSLLSLIIGYSLWHYGLWGAGDAKYLFILSLYIPQYSVISFIGMIGVIIFIYLIISYFRVICKRFKRGFFTHKLENYSFLKKYFYINLLKQINYVALGVFFIFFVTERVIRIFLLEGLSNLYSTAYILNINFPILTIGVIFIFILFLTLKIIYHILLKYDFKVKHTTLCILIIISLFISWQEIINNPQSFLIKILFIITVYLSIYLIIKNIIKVGKIVFIEDEITNIYIGDLKTGMIIEKSFLLNTFGNQEEIIYNNLNISPIKKFIQSFSNPVDEETLVKIKAIYNVTNKYYKDQKPLEFIQVVRTFPLSIIIFLGFISLLLGIHIYISDITIHIISTFLSV